MIYLKKVIILFFTVMIMLIAFYINRFLHKKIIARKSVGHFILFALLNSIAYISLLLLLTLLLYGYKDFFFTE